MNRYKCPACGENQYSSSSEKSYEPCIFCGHPGTELQADLKENEKALAALPDETSANENLFQGQNSTDTDSCQLSKITGYWMSLILIQIATETDARHSEILNAMDAWRRAKKEEMGGVT